MTFTESSFYCTNCGKQGLPVQRSSTKNREPGHLKKLWCYHCKQECNHVEVNARGAYTHEDFINEFINHNFVNGQRLQSYKVFMR